MGRKTRAHSGKVWVGGTSLVQRILRDLVPPDLSSAALSGQNQGNFGYKAVRPSHSTCAVTLFKNGSFLFRRGTYDTP